MSDDSGLVSAMDYFAISEQRPCPECGALVESRRWHDVLQVRRGRAHKRDCEHYVSDAPTQGGDATHAE